MLPLNDTDNAEQFGVATFGEMKISDGGQIVATRGPKLKPVKTTNALAPAEPAAAETLADEILGGRDTSATVSATMKAPVEFLAAAYQEPVSGTIVKVQLKLANLTQLPAARLTSATHVVLTHGQKNDALRLPARPKMTPDWLSCSDGDSALRSLYRQPLGRANGDPRRAAARPEKERETETESVAAPATANAGNGDHDGETLRDAASDGDTDGDTDADVESDEV